MVSGLHIITVTSEVYSGIFGQHFEAHNKQKQRLLSRCVFQFDFARFLEQNSQVSLFLFCIACALLLNESMYHSGDDVGAIVADIGSFSTRIGHAGDDVPAAYFPSVIDMIACSRSSSTEQFSFHNSTY